MARGSHGGVGNSSFPEDITELLVDMTEEEFEAGVAEAEVEADFSDDDEDN